MRDLVVIGGGPVGLATSLYAAHLGLDVTVLEPRLGPDPAETGLDKACGEGIMPGGVEALAGLGVDPPGMAIKGIRYLDRHHQVQTPFSGGPGRGVRRTALHRALLQAVTATGVEVARLAAADLAQDDHGVSIATLRARGGHGPALQARYAIAADGLHSPTRRALGLGAAPPRRGRGSRHGLRRHSGIPPWSEHVEVHWSQMGEAYVTPVAPDVVGIAILTDRREPFEALLGSFPELWERLDGAPAVSRVMGAGPFRQRAARRVAGRVVLVGDAAGYVDALTGEGIAVGLAQAREAVRALAADHPDGYERAWRRVTWRASALTQALVWATRPPAGRRLLVPAAARVPGVFRWSVDALARPR
ncbi:MAG: NAD(P)/FAD-dependent oxidoreductase [Intrasporangium sp.]|uniref:NAD(P)/FAD-dependent oxidoreductase n=1 Tax=Intrasporangium sp. TaxID=1925024 RepID=UPI0026471819|nr:NAD(P)/FAD-dependent oxidoreductase [Intrasporangium sp.]MDN5796986.1 NAD(P)/FAD-dependent oxidoreductase [Intrasporangium sp.]